MELEGKVTIDFTIKGADPTQRWNFPNAECEMCGRTFEQHTIADHKACARRKQESLFGPSE